MPRVYVSIGSNVDREHNLCAAIAALDARFAPVAVSSVYETEAVGFTGDPFLNIVAGFDTALDLPSLQGVMREIEDASGRDRSGPRFGPRTLDVDVLTYGELVSDGPGVEIPRSDITREAFVLVPLAEIAPDACHPVLGERYADLLERLVLDISGMRVVELDLRARAQERA